MQCYGYDIIIDESLKPWLLEVNSGPDLSLFGTRLRPLGLDMLRDLLQVLEG